jgi:hypothetical protein
MPKFRVTVCAKGSLLVEVRSLTTTSFNIEELDTGSNYRVDKLHRYGDTTDLYSRGIKKAGGVMIETGRPADRRPEAH